LGTDVVTLSQSSEFTSAGGGKNVGTGKELRVFDIALGGTDGANYRLAGSTLLTTGSVTPRALNVTGLSGISAVSRVYDGTRNVAIVVAGNAGVGGGNFVPGDDVSIALPSGGISAGTMADKNVGNDKAVVISGLQLNGTDAGNYVVTGTAGVTVNITPLAVTLDGVRAVNRSYDGTTAVAIDTSGGRVLGTIAGDDVALRTSGVAGALADKSAGDGRAVSVSGLALIGTDAGNYSASGGTGLTVNIARRVLNIGFVASNKVFDGSSAASFGGLTNNALAGDLIVLSGGSASFNDANAGNGKTVTLGGLIVGGADAGNYSAANPTFTGSANITPRPLTVAGTSIVRYADDITPLVPGFSTNVGGLVGTDRIASVSFGALPNLANALGGSLYELVPSNAVFGTGTAGNYSVSYVNGLLVVLPKPPRLGEVETGGNTGGQGLALLLSPQELAAGLAALERAAEFAANNTQGGNPLASAAGGADVRRLPSIDPADLAALLSGDGQRITLPTLQRLPLISFDPELMRKLQGAVQRVAP
jgi:trimeric autotransporter adhesin